MLVLFIFYVLTGAGGTVLGEVIVKQLDKPKQSVVKQTDKQELKSDRDDHDKQGRGFIKIRK